MVAVAQSLFFRRDAFTMLSHVGYDLRWGRKWPTCCFRVSVDYRSGCWWLQPMERGQQDVVAWLLSGWQGEEGCVLLTHLFVSCLSSERLSPSGINQCGVLFFLENAVIPRRNLKAFVSSLAFHFSWFQIFDCPTIPNASSYRANNRFVIRFFFPPSPAKALRANGFVTRGSERPPHSRWGMAWSCRKRDGVGRRRRG